MIYDFHERVIQGKVLLWSIKSNNFKWQNNIKPEAICVKLYNYKKVLQNITSNQNILINIW